LSHVRYCILWKIVEVKPFQVVTFFRFHDSRFTFRSIDSTFFGSTATFPKSITDL
jgi:hypothetical protein